MIFTIRYTSKRLLADSTAPPCLGAYVGAYVVGKEDVVWCIRIDTLEDLLRLIRAERCEFIIDSDDDGNSIEIYNDYRE